MNDNFIDPEVVLPSEQVRTYLGKAPEVIRNEKGTVFLYSGDSLLEQGAEQGSWQVAEVSNGFGLSVLMIMRLSPKHTPMDAIAFYLGKNGTVRWMKADGVTDIGREKNDSGWLADFLAGVIDKDEVIDAPNHMMGQIESVLELRGMKGYSTLEYGEVAANGELGYKLVAVRVGSTRSRDDEGNNRGGDLGPTEVYYPEDPANQYTELWAQPDYSKQMVGIEGVRVHRTSRDLPVAGSPTVTSATDGIKSMMNGRWWQAGRRVAEGVREAVRDGNLVKALGEFRDQNILSQIDDISLISVRLPGGK